MNKYKDFINFVVDSGANEVELKTKDFEISVKVNNNTETNNENYKLSSINKNIEKGPKIQAAYTTTTPVEFAEEQTSENTKYLTIKSPLTGTFYRKSSPNEEPYVNVGDEITKGKIICTIESMNYFNEIEAEIDGRIIKILVEDSTPVEFEQPLYLIEK